MIQQTLRSIYIHKSGKIILSAIKGQEAYKHNQHYKHHRQCDTQQQPQWLLSPEEKGAAYDDRNKSRTIIQGIQA